MLSLHANVYALPATAIEGPRRTVRGSEAATLAGEAGGPPMFLEVLPVTFETMQQRLMELPRCDCEPDGFFLLTGNAEDGTFWRLNGHMQEYQPEGTDEPRMHRTELSGECPAGLLDMVLRTMGWPEAELAFELIQEGATLNESDFRKYAAASPPPKDANAAKGVSCVVSTTAAPPKDVAAKKPSAPAVEDDVDRTQPNPRSTPWHITFGTYGTRLHGDARPTVDSNHNEFGTPFVERDDLRHGQSEAGLAGDPVQLTQSQREFIEQTLPTICERGGWQLHTAAAQEDHVHVVCDIRSNIHGERVRRLMKRWLTEALNAEWPDADRPRWWAVQGSNKAIKNASYLRNAIAYVERQRTLR